MSHAGRTYTVDADFDEGTLTGLDHDAPNSHQLQISLDKPAVTDPYLWVANYAQGTVTKVDTRTGVQVGMYDSVLTRNWDGTTLPVPGPRSDCNSPSRTTVDADGNAFVANRGYCNYNTNISTIASLTKIAGVPGHCVDRNNNGKLDTSRDANGDGRINISDPAEFLGQADECLLWTRTYAAPGDWGRSVAVDAEQNLWVGGYHTSKLYKLSSKSGQLLQFIDPNAETGTRANNYGLAIGPGGYIYTSDPGAQRLRKIDPNAPTGQHVVGTLMSPTPTYGIAVDRKGIVWLGNWSTLSRGGVLRADFNAGTVQAMVVPSTSDCNGYTRGVAVDGDGEVWVACWSTSRLLRFNSAGIFLASYATAPGTLGVAIDSQLRIWSSNQTSNTLTRIDKTGAVGTQSFPAGGAPYSYWDMTGFQHRNFTLRQGEWVVVHDDGKPGTEWGTIHWNREGRGATPVGTQILVYARAADDRETLESRQFVEALRSAPLGGVVGRYVQIKVVLRTQRLDSSPVLSDLTVVARGTWSDTGSIGDDTLHHRAVRLKNGEVLIVGGFRSDARVFSPSTVRWRLTGLLAEARRFHTATLLDNGHVLVTGGANGARDATAVLYDPTTEVWKPTSSMLEARRNHTATQLNDGRILVVGGAMVGRSATAELYEPASGTWTPTGSLLEGRSQHTATLLPGGRVLVTGGIGDSGAGLASAEVYDPATGTWTAAGNMSLARVDHTATGLNGGRVLVAGGRGNTGQAASAEVYNAATNTWTTTGSMGQPRYMHAATELLNGWVLVSGGFHDFTGIHYSAELYNPATGTWSTTGAMRVDRYLHTLTLLQNGEVLAAGGFSSVDQWSSELFLP